MSNLCLVVCVQGPLVIPTRELKNKSAPPKKRKSIYDTINDTEMVEKVFGFLPSMMGQDGQTSPIFEVRQGLFFKR